MTTRNGVVTLTGAVTSEEAKDAAIALARDTDGVPNMHDRLKVNAAPTAQQH